MSSDHSTQTEHGRTDDQADQDAGDESSVAIQRQTLFTETDAIKPESTPVETSSKAFEADVDHRERDTQLD